MDIEQLKAIPIEQLVAAAQPNQTNGATGTATANSSLTGGSIAGQPTAQPATTPAQTSRYLIDVGISDHANALCVQHLYGDKIAYADGFGWIVYNGKYWERETAESFVDHAIIDTLSERIKAALADNPQAHDKLIKFCIPNDGRIRAAKNRLLPLVTTKVSEFEKAPDLLNVQNGTVNLRTGKLDPHSHVNRFMHCANGDYDPNADCTVWVNWLTDAVGGDKEIVDWLQMAVGYTLTGSVREGCLFYLYGPTRSGKGTFTGTLLELLGKPLAKSVSFSLFTAKREGDTQNFDLAPLKPCRFIAASESNSYERFNEALVKTLTGEDEISCAFKFGEHFNYIPQFKIWLSSNEPINADPDKDATWGRFHLIEFPNSHLGKEDRELKEKLQSPDALKGVLRWAVEGAKRWYATGATGLPKLAKLENAKKSQRDELDHVQAWINESCVVSSSTQDTNSNLFTSYRNWCVFNGVTPKAQKGLTQSLKSKGFQPSRDMTSRFVKGIQAK